MRKSDVIEYFGGTPTSTAKALNITVAAVSQWGEIIPEDRAYKIESLTKRRLRVDPALYPKSEMHAPHQAMAG